MTTRRALVLCCCVALALVQTACHASPTVLLQVHYEGDLPPRVPTTMRLCNERCARLCETGCDVPAGHKVCTADETVLPDVQPVRDATVAIFRDAPFDIELTSVPCGDVVPRVVLSIDAPRISETLTLKLVLECRGGATGQVTVSASPCCKEAEGPPCDLPCELRDFSSCTH